MEQLGCQVAVVEKKSERLLLLLLVTIVGIKGITCLQLASSWPSQRFWLLRPRFAKKSVTLQTADFYCLFTAEADEGMEKFGMQTFCDDIWKRAQIYVHIMGPIICLHSF